jgi:signal transduction histidine kinase
VDEAADVRLVCIRVSDDGPGIPADERLRVAQPGVRLDEQVEGHGFGLAIASDLASLYAGRLTLDERPGGGLLVELRLPCGAAG